MIGLAEGILVATMSMVFIIAVDCVMSAGARWEQDVGAPASPRKTFVIP
jgi:hypothetical protein